MKSKRHNSAAVFPLIRSYEDGLLTKREFCEQTNLKECSFSYWLKKYRESGAREGRSSAGEEEVSSFIRIEADQRMVDSYGMEIILKGGSRIRFTSLVPIEYIEAILSIQ